jgi:hypothetical protein
MMKMIHDLSLSLFVTSDLSPKLNPNPKINPDSNPNPKPNPNPSFSMICPIALTAGR